MNDAINLIKNNEKKIALSNKKLSIFRYLALSFLFVVSFSSITLFIFIALSPLPNLINREKQELIRISPYHEQMAQIKYLKDRLFAVSQIINKRANYSEILESFKTAVPADLKVEDLKCENKKITVVLSSNSLTSISNYIDKIASDNKLYRSVNLMGIVKSVDSNEYTFTLEFLRI